MDTDRSCAFNPFAGMRALPADEGATGRSGPGERPAPSGLLDALRSIFARRRTQGTPRAGG